MRGLHARYAFLSRLLMRQQRFAEARDVLDGFIQTAPERPWSHFQIALGYEGLQDVPQAVFHFERYQQLHGKKRALETLMRLAELRT